MITTKEIVAATADVEYLMQFVKNAVLENERASSIKGSHAIFAFAQIASELMRSQWQNIDSRKTALQGLITAIEGMVMNDRPIVEWH